MVGDGEEGGRTDNDDIYERGGKKVRRIAIAVIIKSNQLRARKCCCNIKL